MRLEQVLDQLERPPVIVIASRGKAMILFAVSAAFAAGGAAMVYSERSPEAWFVLLFFGFCTAVAAFLLFSPAKLTLSPDGLTWFNGLRVFQFHWRDVQNFRPWRASTVSAMVGFDFSPDYAGPAHARHVNHHLTGVEGSFGGNWSLNAKDLCELLNAAHARWGNV